MGKGKQKRQKDRKKVRKKVKTREMDQETRDAAEEGRCEEVDLPGGNSASPVIVSEREKRRDREKVAKEKEKVCSSQNIM